jgi:hypothetical protein
MFPEKMRKHPLDGGGFVVYAGKSARWWRISSLCGKNPLDGGGFLDSFEH